MAKRKKYPVLPNGYGSIRYLGKNRSRPYAVHPPATECDQSGHYIRPKALCYVDDWYVGFAVLSSYHAGTYHPGDEILLQQYMAVSDADLDSFCKRLLRDHRMSNHSSAANEPTFADVYEQFFDWKFGEKASKKLSSSARYSCMAAFKNTAILHDRAFRSITLEELQSVLNTCPLKQASIEIILSLFKQMYRFAEPRELCDRNYAQYLVMPNAEGDAHGEPFTEEDLRKLWQHQGDDAVALILIMCYSGFRISAYAGLEVNLSEGYFRGGVKTAASKNRIVPIHSSIFPLVQKRTIDGKFIIKTSAQVRVSMRAVLVRLGIDPHTPHDCRHTFSTLCEKYKVNENDRKRLLGHSFQADITNGIYGHRTVDELRSEIEKIKLPDGI
ncbi:MAG: integrase [Eubacteriales bacterium]|nr:integrase [Eubacteriales bacterium]